jgi:3-dehydroquinate synthase
MTTKSTQRFDSNNGVWQVSSLQPVEYIVVEKNNFFATADYDEAVFGPKTKHGATRRLVVIDDVVSKHFGNNIKEYFARNNVFVEMLVLRADEEVKMMTTVFTILDKITELKLKRRSEPVIAIGGGVLLDIVGFATSLYRRGMPYVRIPTTLIGLVDAGIGIKTGVNYSTHKNRIGTYHPPSSVLLDATFLRTLDERHLRNGMGEILKMALIKDGVLFSLLEKSAQDIVQDKLQTHPHSQAIMRRSIHGMLEELEKNLWEKDLERLVDFGHSFSPSIEMKALPALLHGEAVAIDMAICVAIAHHRKLLTSEERDRIFNVYQVLKLPIIDHELCTSALLAKALEDTTSHRDGLQRMPLPHGIGNAVFVNDITNEEIAAAISYLKETY